jgi:ribosomal protein S18 acetylase RimI-like enzyme
VPPGRNGMHDDLTFKTGWQPGLIGEIAAAHGRYCAKNWEFGVFFESSVGWDCGRYLERAGPDDLTLSVWDGDRFAGSLIMDVNDLNVVGEGHLRWFIVTLPGQGIGRRLMDQAMAHIDHRGLSCFLTTFQGLDTARRLYEGYGFVLTHEQPGESWGTKVVEQRFDRPAA